LGTLEILLIQLALILIVTRACSFLAIKIHIVPVLGELMAGLFLGPTIFGFLLPAWQSTIFTAQGTTNAEILSSFSSMGLILLMFVGGLEIDMDSLKKNFWRALSISVGAVGLSFTIGFIFAGFLPEEMFPSPNRLAFQLFFANALAITSVPVLIKIFMDLGLLNTRMAKTAIVAGVIVDTVGWVILAIVTRGTTVGFSLEATLTTCGYIAAFLVITFTLGKFLLKRLVKLQGSEDALSINFLGSVLAMMLLGAAATEYLHIHPVLGAFCVGLMVGTWKLSSRIKEKLSDFAFSFFIPIFLATLGLRANLWLIDSWTLWGITALIVLVVSFAKYFGAGSGAKLSGMTWLESTAIGAAANTKGAMGLVAAQVAFDLGVIPGNLYAMLVIVSLIRTLLPIFELQRLRKPLLAEEANRTSTKS
jgi:Kef-type K+ transport system membrane component KefB